MRRLILPAVFLCALVAGLHGVPVHAGCTVREVCGDVMDSADLQVVIGGSGTENSVTWSSDSENGDVSIALR